MLKSCLILRGKQELMQVNIILFYSKEAGACIRAGEYIRINMVHSLSVEYIAAAIAQMACKF